MASSAGAVVLACALALPAAGQSFSDSEFASADWTISKIVDTTPGTAAACSATQNSVGNPGNCRSISHAWQITGPGVSIGFAHLRQGVSISPSALPGIVAIEWSLQASCDSAPYVGAVAFGPVLRQNGKWFTSSGGAAIVGRGWTNLGGVALAGDWIEAGGGSGKPDFSPAGGPIEIGFYSANGGSGTTLSLSALARVDNFSIRLRRTCPADLNLDGVVDNADFVSFAAAYITFDCADPAMPPTCPADLNTDLFVDGGDFVLFVEAYNEFVCP